MRADEFINSDEKLDEILPLIGMAARSVAGMAAAVSKNPSKYSPLTVKQANLAKTLRKISKKK